MDYLESGNPANASQPCDWFIAPLPRLRGLAPTLTVAAIFALPLALVAGFIITGRPLDGLYAVPLLTAAVAYKVRENLG